MFQNLIMPSLLNETSCFCLGRYFKFTFSSSLHLDVLLKSVLSRNISAATLYPTRSLATPFLHQAASSSLLQYSAHILMTQANVRACPFFSLPLLQN
jgi:hypothetical protein